MTKIASLNPGVTTDRHAYALAHPLNDPSADISPYRRVDGQPDGTLLLTILAIDR